MNAYHPPLAIAPLADTRPGALCAYHYPACVPADFWDANGHACCNACGAQWDRVCRMPKWSLKDAR